MRCAVVGHVEWAEAVRVDRMPVAGQIVHATPAWSEPAGGGGVTAVQLGRLAGEVHLFTALGDDDLGRRCARELEGLGVTVHAAWRSAPSRRVFVHLDGDGERTITVIGPRMGPEGADDLPWDLLDHTTAVYLTAGDRAAVHQARRAALVVATARAMDSLRGSEVSVDALVASANDPGERYTAGDLDPDPVYVLRTDGARGGTWDGPGGPGRWDAVPLPAPVGDTFGPGDSFAAGVTVGLTQGIEAAAALGAECGAACATGLGPYGAPMPAWST